MPHLIPIRLDYDVPVPSQYEPLYEALAALGAVRLLKSAQLLLTSDPLMLLAALRRISPRTDFAVTELVPGSTWLTAGANPEAVAWLSRYVTPRTV